MKVEPVFKPFGFDKAKMIDAMAQKGLDGILLTTPENVYYTTGYTCLPTSGNPVVFGLRRLVPYFVHIAADGRVTLLCWAGSTHGVYFGADEVRGFSDFDGAQSTLVNHFGSSLGPHSVLGVESTCPLFVTELFETRCHVGKLEPIDALMLQLRLIKSPHELELMQRSSEIGAATLLELYDEVHVGMSRLDLIQRAKQIMLKNGATGISHMTFTFGKANPEIAIDETLDENSLVSLNVGGSYLGYISDNRRYAFTGEVPAALAIHHQLMVEIVDSVGRLLVQGTCYSDIFQHASELWDQHRLPYRKYLTTVGHSLGLEIEEEWLTDEPNRRVRAGMVINIELYAPAPTGHYVGDEETYVISDTGPTRISLLPTTIRSVG